MTNNAELIYYKSNDIISRGYGGKCTVLLSLHFVNCGG